MNKNEERNLRQKIEAHERYDANPNYCRECGKKIEIPLDKSVGEGRKKRFCTRHCSAKYNNRMGGENQTRLFGPRPSAKKRTCAKCGGEMARQAKGNSCRQCRDQQILLHTKAEFYSRGKDQRLARGKLGNIARRLYMKSGSPRSCAVCGYSTHVEVCHIKDVASFPGEAKLSEINSPDNLVALCPNHHWEFDNGLLKL